MPILLLIIFLGSIQSVGAEEKKAPAVDEKLIFTISPATKYEIIEKSNFSQRENGKYLGYTYNEVRGLLTVSAVGSDRSDYEGKYYVMEETKRENRLVAARIEKVIPARFSILANGVQEIPSGQVYPLLRSFPVFSSQPVAKGDRWTAYGMRIVDPGREEKYTRVKFYCEYVYEGMMAYKGQLVHSIRAQYALRYKRGDDPEGDARLSRISGKHVVSILLSVDPVAPLFMKDELEEQYLYEDKRTLELTGFILTWFSEVILLDKTKLVKTVEEDLKKNQVPDVRVVEHPDGVSLSLQKIHFMTNEARILPEERPRLDALAKILRSIPDRTFLVVGHTTDIGPRDFLHELSVKRAKAIVDALAERGIPAERLLYEGRCFSEPLAPNDTEENKVKNRRVEIIILED